MSAGEGLMMVEPSSARVAAYAEAIFGKSYRALDLDDRVVAVIAVADAELADLRVALAVGRDELHHANHRALLHLNERDEARAELQRFKGRRPITASEVAIIQDAMAHECPVPVLAEGRLANVAALADEWDNYNPLCSSDADVLAANTLSAAADELRAVLASAPEEDAKRPTPGGEAPLDTAGEQQGDPEQHFWQHTPDDRPCGNAIDSLTIRDCRQRPQGCACFPAETEGGA